jgi:hypothetical protein
LRRPTPLNQSDETRDSKTATGITGNCSFFSRVEKLTQQAKMVVTAPLEQRIAGELVLLLDDSVRVCVGPLRLT